MHRAWQWLCILAATALAADSLQTPVKSIPAMAALEVDSSEANLRSVFEQGEYYRTYKLESSFNGSVGSRWITLDSVTLTTSPQRQSDQISSNSQAVFNALYKVNPTLYSGMSVSGRMNGLYDSGKESWLTETDHERFSLKTRYIPGRLSVLALNTGIQTSGNKSQKTTERETGWFYEFNTLLLSPFKDFKSCSLMVSDNHTFVDYNDNAEGRYLFDGSSPVSSLGLLRFNLGLTTLRDRSFFYSPRNSSERYLNLSFTHKPMGGLILADTLMIVDHRLSYPDNPHNDKRNLTIAGGITPSAVYKRLTLRAQWFRSQDKTDLASAFPLKERPSANELKAAELQLSNESVLDTRLCWNAAFRYYRGYTLGFARLLNIRRYDYNYTFIDISGLKRTNPDARDLLYDNDTLFLKCPARDTLEIRLSRSSRTINYINALRSSQNRIGTAYQAELSHTFYGAHSASTRNAFFLGVDQDSVLYLQNSVKENSQGQLFRKRGFYTFTDINALPGFRNLEDSVILGGLYSAEEDGSLLTGRLFRKKDIYNQYALNFRLYKEFNTDIFVMTGVDYARTAKFTFEAFPIPSKDPGFSEKLFRNLFSIDDHFQEEYTSINRDFFLRAGIFRKLAGREWSGYMEAKKIQSFFSDHLTKNYLLINTNIGVSL